MHRRGRCLARNGGSLNENPATSYEGTFTGPFTHSPVGKLEPNGARVVWDFMNIFRFDDSGRLVEEIVRTDNRNFLRQLGAEAA